jgi:hypothetical protein
MRSVLIIWNSRPHKSFDLGLGELDRLVYRFAPLRALGDHFADGPLREHLRAEVRWCRIASEVATYFLPIIGCLPTPYGVVSSFSEPCV